MEPDRQGSRPKCGSTRTNQSFLGTRYGNFSGLKILEGNFLGARSAGLKAQMWQHPYQSKFSRNPLWKFIGSENFGRQFSWSPIGRVQGPYGAEPWCPCSFSNPAQALFTSRSRAFTRRSRPIVPFFKLKKEIYASFPRVYASFSRAV